jgi:hypothetical protein
MGNGQDTSNRRLARLAALGAATALAMAAAAPPQPGSAAARREERGGQPDLVVSRERLRESMSFRKRTGRAGACTIVENCLGLGQRRTLEFDTYVVNTGDGDLRLGNPAERPHLYEYSACHGHYHLKDSFVYGVAHGGADSTALFDAASGSLVFRNANDAGPADGSLEVGAGGLPLAGDWTISGPSLPGAYDPATGRFALLERANAPAPAVFTYAPEGGGLLPIAGDWDGDGRDTVGLFSPATGKFYLKRKNAKGRKATVVTMEAGAGDWVPVAGDWNGDDVDSVGLYDRATGAIALKNVNESGPPDLVYALGAGGATPIAGDWNGDGADTIGLYDPATATFALHDEHAAGEPDAVVSFEGSAADGLVPLAGDWDYEPGALLLPGRKEAFCWLDTQRISGTRELQFRDCNVNQGLTAGWCDIYVRNTDCQWIDITGLAPGVYQVTITVNAAGLINESDQTNNSASVKVRIPAPRRQKAPPEVTVVAPATAGDVAVGQPVTIRWQVSGGAATRQELWLVEIDEHHPSKVRLIADDIGPDVRSYTWVPTRDFESPAAQFMVRAQNDEHFVGRDARSPAVVRIR